MSSEEVDLVLGFHSDSPAEAIKELKNGLARGDFVGADAIAHAKRSLEYLEKKVLAEWGRTPEGAMVRQADAAERSAKTANIAIGVSLGALIVSVAQALWTFSVSVPVTQAGCTPSTFLPSSVSPSSR